jgi:SWI/SNF-related matrix-associated actin-dependent regulator 1 of chromatin subfamily A
MQRARRRILLTGTPALSRPVELYPQLDALDCTIFKTFKKFALRYCNAFHGPFGWDYTGSSHLAGTLSYFFVSLFHSLNDCMK